jgi:glycosyltransferase involved in cell wall biosynthesis
VTDTDPGMAATVGVTFVVIAYNEAAGIATCVRSIAGQKELASFEIVVVDDCSDDATPFVLAELTAEIHQLRVVRLPKNKGRGAARAAGVRVARGELVAMVDADISLPADWYARCLAHLDGRDVVSGVAVPDGDVGYLARRFGLAPKAVPASTRTTGNNALFRRTVFERVSYEEELRDGEDIALDHEMTSAGIVSAVVPGLQVEHREHKTFLRELRWLFQSGLGASRQLERYRKIRGPDIAFAAIVLASVLPWLSGRGRAGRLGMPLALLLAISCTHVTSKFEVRRDPVRFLGAVLADGALLSSYFSGRLAGHVRLRLPARAR